MNSVDRVQLVAVHLLRMLHLWPLRAPEDGRHTFQVRLQRNFEDSSRSKADHRQSLVLNSRLHYRLFLRKSIPWKVLRLLLHPETQEKLNPHPRLHRRLQCTCWAA